MQTAVHQETRALPSATVADLAALRHVLSGASAIDSARVWFPDAAHVDSFLRLHQFDTDNPIDLARLQQLHHEATTYLTEAHRYRLPRAVEQPESIHALFLAAAHEPGRLQRMACMTLKVMSTMQHLAARELVFNLPLSEADLLARLNERVFRTIDDMRAAGVGVEGFATGKKSWDSLVTKLLAKRETLAAQIYDRLRFRIVLRTKVDLVRALIYLTHHLTPFNFVIPGQSQNGLMRIEEASAVCDLPIEVVRKYFGSSEDEPIVRERPPNEFSGSTYRCINFVADIPMRLDDVARTTPPAIVVVQAEIQLVDAETDVQNNHGENAHDLYKKRQRAQVRRRLEGQDGPLESGNGFVEGADEA